MRWVLSHTSWDFKNESLIFQGVRTGSDGDLVLCGGFMGRELPSYLPEGVVSDCIERFQDDDMLMSDGKVSKTAEEGAVSLNGIQAVWVPDYSDMLPELLKSYYTHMLPKEPVERTSYQRPDGYRTMFPSEVVAEIRGRRVLLFTGAGISMAPGLPDLEGLSALVESILTPVDGYFRDVFEGAGAERLAKVWQYLSAFTESEPNRAHWIIADICMTHGWQLVTGNFDGLHEKTGVTPIFQNADEVVIPELGFYDVMITVGLKDGIGKVADEYRALNPRGQLIAINQEPPWYLGPDDFYVPGEVDEVLSEIRRLLNS